MSNWTTRSQKSIVKRMVSMLMVFAMVLALIPALPFAAHAAGKSVTIHFNNSQNWTTVNGYVWNAATNQFIGTSWPGAKISKNADNGAWYDLKLSGITATNIGVIFNNGSKQTGDIKINGITDGGEYWCNYTEQYTTGTGSSVAPAGWNTNDTPRDVIIHFKNTKNWSSVYGYTWCGDSYPTGVWSGTKLTADASNPGWYTLEAKGITSTMLGCIFNDGGTNQTADIDIKNIPAENAEYWYAGSLSTTQPSGWGTGTPDVTDPVEETDPTVPTDPSGDTVKIHFVNTTGWEGVCAYAWVERGEDDGTYNGMAWPGKALTMDADGNYTFEISYKPAAGESIGYIFHNNGGNQTEDLFVDYATLNKAGGAELWVQPGTATEGIHACSVVNSPSKLIISPEVKGNQVTFRYQSSAASVVVAGTMNGWSTTANKMTKGSDGIYTCTMTLQPGIYQYKFVETSTNTWVNDPKNPLTIGKDYNNVVVVGDGEAVDNNEITVKLHYYRPDGKYTGWNVWMWTLDQEAEQYDFAVENGEMVATMTVDGRATNFVCFIPRLNKWENQEYGERRIDLTKVVSGTVHCYVNSGEFATTKLLGADAVIDNKVNTATLDYDTGKIVVNTGLPVSGDAKSAFKIVNTADSSESVAITNIVSNGCQYTLTLDKTLDLVNLYKYKISFNGYTYDIGILGVYASAKFDKEFTYTGKDLGATWSKNSTTFKLWAPTAETVQVALYKSGTEGTNDLIKKVAMTRGDYGVWSATVSGDLHGTYYTYLVKVDGEDVEACDPYARTTGVNGNRAMVINLDSTDPEGWDLDISPNKDMTYTDAIIYELHVRDFSIDDSSGVKDEYQGKFMALTQSGTTTAKGTTTGLDYLKELGITHLHLLPFYDYGSVDEADLDTPQYNWGYDPQNYNVPEGSYSTDPYDGNARVAEVKQMVKALHENNINVVMDVVYNHVYDSGKFAMNQIVPGYFSRQWSDGFGSNGSGCGNDTASERDMVRKYIVESILYWHDEYHIDGFRFDLVGLLDAQTINEIVDSVHAVDPEVIFYGEGWQMDTAVEGGTSHTGGSTVMATQHTASATPNFAYFSDTVRNLLAGDNGRSTGFVSGTIGVEEDVSKAFTATTWWCPKPTQTVNYVSCHDNYTLMDKLCLTRSDASRTNLIKMNNLSAAIYMTAQGIPFIHAGEEFLREKIDENGVRDHNSYKSSDYVNKLRWSNLDTAAYADVSDYYKGLIEFRKNHAALRLTTAAEVAKNVKYHWVTNEVVLFNIQGKNSVPEEVSDGIVVIFNATTSSKTVNLSKYGVASGTWKVCVNAEDAGTDVLATVTNGSVTVSPISAMVLVKGETVDTDSVYVKAANKQHTMSQTWSYDGTNHWHECTCCATPVKADMAEHTLVSGVCSVCGYRTAAADASISLRYPTLSFESEICYNVYYTVKNVDVSVEDMGLITWNTKPTDLTIASADAVIPGAVYDSGSGMYMVRTNGIPAKNLGDKLYFRVYAKLSDGSYVYSQATYYNAKLYAQDRFANSTNDSIKALCVAMLNYGAAAQTFFEYNTDDLMNASLTTAQQALVKAYTPEMVDAVKAADSNKIGQFKANSGFSGGYPSVSFEGAFAINYYFTPKYAVQNDMILYCWDYETYSSVGTLTEQNADAKVVMSKGGSSSQYFGSYTGIAAKEIDQTVYVAGVYESNGVRYSTGVIPYSLATYCVDRINNGSEGMKQFAQATVVYGYYAKAYFANI